MKDYKVLIVSSRFPPYYSGAGLRAYNHSLRLKEKNNLSFVLKCRFAESKLTGNSKILKEPLPSKFEINVPSGELSLSDKTKSKLVRSILVFWVAVSLFFSVGYYIVRFHRKIDIIHCYSVTFLPFFAVVWGKIFRKKILLDLTLFGADDPYTILKNKSGQIGSGIRGLQFRWADRINNVSDSLMRSCLDAGLQNEKLTLITNAVDTEKFFPLDETGKSKQKKKLFGNENLTVVLFVGALIERKGFDIAWNCFKALNRMSPVNNFLFAIIGREGSEVEKPSIRDVIAEASSLNLTEKVKYLGTVSDIEKYFQASDYFIFPSRSEGSPNALKEAMGCGLVAIVNYLEGITSTIVQNNISGILVKEQDAESYAKKIIELEKKPSVYSAISKNAVDTVRQKYSSAKIFEEYCTVYSELIDTRV